MYGGKVLKKIRTATITFHKAINYGAILQTYALQHSILKLGIDNDVIDYDCKLISDEYKLINIKSIKLFVKSLISFRLYYYKKNKFKSFIKKYIILTNPVTKDVLKSKEFNNKYDFFITGSDQVWNYEITNLDEVYFLNFVKDEKKIKSYAASFGISYIPINLSLKYKEYLKRFSSILVREKTGAELIEKLIEKKVNVVLDPVLLLNKNEWDKIASKTKFDDIKNKYILVYITTPYIKLFAEKLSIKYKIPIFNITDLILKKKNKIGNTECKLGPEEFINAIKNARFVVTASFHAVVFSIIYNKEFFINNVDKTKENRSSRQKDLLDLLGIKDREIFNHDDDTDFSSIDWNDVNKKLEIERNKSLNELKKILGVND